MCCSIYHESMERLCENDYINNIMSVDYYDHLQDICSDMCGKFGSWGRTETHHVCALVNVKDGKVFIGENSTRQQHGCPISTHAEMDALRKLMKTKQISNGNQKRIDKYDVIVIRISKTNKLGSSRPCYHCICGLLNNPVVKIRYVYYSLNNGKIIREKLEDMLSCELTSMSTGWRRRNKNATPVSQNARTISSPTNSNNNSDCDSDSDSDSIKITKSPRNSRSSSRSVSPIYDLVNNNDNCERIIVPEKKFQKVVPKLRI